MKLYFPRRSYRVSGFRVSSHAVKQMRSRGVTKSALRYNLKHKPLHTTGIKYNKRGRPSYIRYSRNKVKIKRHEKRASTKWTPFYFWRRERDSNPRTGISRYTISSRAPQTSSATFPQLTAHSKLRFQIAQLLYQTKSLLSILFSIFLRFF